MEYPGISNKKTFNGSTSNELEQINLFSHQYQTLLY